VGVESSPPLQIAWTNERSSPSLDAVGAPQKSFVVVSNVPCSWLIFPCIDFAIIEKNMFDHDAAFYALSYATVTGVVVVVLVLGVIWASR